MGTVKDKGYKPKQVNVLRLKKFLEIKKEINNGKFNGK
jgi:hypothetical protein